MNLRRIAVRIAAKDFLELCPHEFDQSSDGWRKIMGHSKQAEMIRTYLDEYSEGKTWKENVPDGKTVDPYLLWWHAGQCFAFDHKYDQAIECMSKSKDFIDSDIEWERYVDATIAFLQNDKEIFSDLADQPNYNEETLQRLMKNWGKTYDVAYED